MALLKTTKRPSKKPLIVTARMETILRAVAFYRYMTALDVAQYLQTPKTIGYVRNILADLCGGEDFRTHSYLYRFPLPKSGNSERVYTLGSRGRDYLSGHCGIPIDWYFRPDKVRHFSFSHVIHSLLLTRFLVAARVWSATRPDFQLTRTCISYEFQQTSPVVEVPFGTQVEKVPVVPDGWLLFEQLQGGAHAGWLPVLLEIDRGMEYQARFKQHIRSRLEFIRSGGYERLFGQKAVTIAYATTGDRPEYRETRRRTMCVWTREVLLDMRLSGWASIFRFCSLTHEELYALPLFAHPLWFRPDSETPVCLLDV
jgi:hypothetical protein